MEHYLSIIIGAGQAGLATAHQLTSRGLIPAQDFLLIDANPAPGGAWRHRWDSLTLGKAHNIASLPGMPAPLADASSPASHVVASYYGAYEDKFQLRPYRPARVRSVHASHDEPEPRGAFLVALESGEQFSADAIVNATGTWDRPYIPYIPGIGSFGGRQLHTKDYSAAEDFASQHVLVVGGGLSAVQFLLELEGIAQTTWATRRAPDFTNTEFDKQWGLDVEKKVRERVFSGNPPASVVSTTGIPPWREYLDAVERGVLVSRGMFDAIDATGVRFGEAATSSRTAASDGAATGGRTAASDESTAHCETVADGDGAVSGGFVGASESGAAWQPYPAGTHLAVDVIFWNTGFRPVLDHLAPLRLRSRKGGIVMRNEVSPAANPRVFLAGYGSTASTVGATRAGRLAAREVIKVLDL
ncbi:NAD(P)/FAD-dependent oxidoreductase [Corynebacterium accolens]|uniref:NAD(P)-binding domain-containing protein n=1 Tax=Corynebacterium accolens TaxID=38284 RepID=UPI00266ECDDD|nr:NAD(P)-binding domain-containing protein [Corynebacterium accolens]WKS68005.1 NAD(P)/FAD-dependent oxidoreductase [Corynebacterium accolens]WKS72268.1 NAD(P)/FAD-dependent oxidoreductase [Corynebacterium accolens]WKS72588.1 NAD(P)/FAD-dependent oxidoreductase [Corynebacterium accolens]